MSSRAGIIKSKISPNAAEGKSSLGLKDLVNLVTEKTNGQERNITTNKPETAQKSSEVQDQGKKGNQSENKSRTRKKKKKHGKKSTPVASPVKTSAISDDANKNSGASSSPVRPEIEYQEKSLF